MANVDAVVLSGGSAFGQAAGTGVAEWLEEQDRGFKTAHGRVPIVVGMSLYDLGVGDASVRPTAANGRAAAESASSEAGPLGAIGAGIGATVGKWAGRDLATPGGLGAATYRNGNVIVTALIAVNAVGVIDDGTSLADIGPPAMSAPADPANTDPTNTDPTNTDPTNTTIGIIVTNATADKTLCHWLAQSGHDGLARSLLPFTPRPTATPWWRWPRGKSRPTRSTSDSSPSKPSLLRSVPSERRAEGCVGAAEDDGDRCRAVGVRRQVETATACRCDRRRCSGFDQQAKALPEPRPRGPNFVVGDQHAPRFSRLQRTPTNVAELGGAEGVGCDAGNLDGYRFSCIHCGPEGGRAHRSRPREASALNGRTRPPRPPDRPPPPQATTT